MTRHILSTTLTSLAIALSFLPTDGVAVTQGGSVNGEKGSLLSALWML
ncbi:MAG: hypothetical protein BKPUNTRY_000889, partial [Candidatus Fervidibacter sp.]